MAVALATIMALTALFAPPFSQITEESSKTHIFLSLMEAKEHKRGVILTNYVFHYVFVFRNGSISTSLSDNFIVSYSNPANIHCDGNRCTVEYFVVEGERYRFIMFKDGLIRIEFENGSEASLPDRIIESMLIKLKYGSSSLTPERFKAANTGAFSGELNATELEKIYIVLAEDNNVWYPDPENYGEIIGWRRGIIGYNTDITLQINGIEDWLINSTLTINDQTLDLGRTGGRVGFQREFTQECNASGKVIHSHMHGRSEIIDLYSNTGLWTRHSDISNAPKWLKSLVWASKGGAEGTDVWSITAAELAKLTEGSGNATILFTANVNITSTYLLKVNNKQGEGSINHLSRIFGELNILYKNDGMILVRYHFPIYQVVVFLSDTP
ncbi:MAG: hypothetical protein ACTSUS_09275 [Candidatus Freyarchaeota archaeon]